MYLISANYPSASSRRARPMRSRVRVREVSREGGGECETKISQSRPLSVAHKADEETCITVLCGHGGSGGGGKVLITGF